MPAGSTVDAGSPYSNSFGLLDERIKRWIWEAGWTELKDVQERAIPLLLDGGQDVILAAMTNGAGSEACAKR